MQNINSLSTPVRLATIALLLFSSCLFAQNKKGDHLVTTGTFISFVPDYQEVPFFVHYDFGATDKLSIGLGFAHGTYGYYSHRITRNSYTVRMLYHLTESESRWDFYLGGQAGVNQWSSPGIRKDSLLSTPIQVFPLLPVRANTFTPSGQLLVGGRYLVNNWLGLSAEAAVGSPYLFSAGITMNINNTRSGIRAVRNEEVLPAEKKNIIKLNATSVIGIPGVSYERLIFKRFSAEIGGSFQFKGSPLQTGNMITESGRFSEDDSVAQELKTYGMIKCYLSSKHLAFPGGLYIGALYDYKRSTTFIHVTETQTSNTVNYDYQKETEQRGGGLALGYQHLFGSHFTVDVFGGMRFASARLISMHYIDSSVTEEDFLAHFGNHINPLKPDPKTLILKVNIGYAF